MLHVWLASAPKCGNTWVRFLLYQYFYGEVKASDDVWKEIPDIHAPGQYQAAAARAKAAGRARILVKTHQRFNPRLHVGRYVYIIRHPRDMILSLMRFYDVVASKGAARPISDEQYIRAFIQRRQNPLKLEEEHGAPEEHWHSWLDQQQTPGIVVRYEDLKADSLRELRRMVESMGEAFDEVRGKQAAALSTFDRMKALEIKEKRAGVSSEVFSGAAAKVREGMTFMNKGKSGQSLDAFGKGLNAACDAAFKDTIERFGYGKS